MSTTLKVRFTRASTVAFLQLINVILMVCFWLLAIAMCTCILLHLCVAFGN